MEKLDENSFESFTEKDKVIVDFWAEWCGPCKNLAPIYEELSEEMEDVHFGKVNVDDHGEIAQENSVRGIPTMVLFEDGEEVDRIVGFVPKDQLRQKIETAFA